MEAAVLSIAFVHSVCGIDGVGQENKIAIVARTADYLVASARHGAMANLGLGHMVGDGTCRELPLFQFHFRQSFIEFWV